jgi:hypothetical protein
MNLSTNKNLEESLSQLEFFIIINSDGNFFRRKGYSGYGQTWVSDIKKARTYNKIGPARSQVTWFSNTYPNYPYPAIIKFKVGSYEILHEVERINKAIKTKEEKIALKKAKQAKYDLEYAQRNLERAKKDLENARLKVRK